MTRKDYVLAASLVAKERARFGGDAEQQAKASIIEDSFAEFFRASEGRFDEVRFRAACQA